MCFHTGFKNNNNNRLLKMRSSKTHIKQLNKLTMCNV